MDAAGMIDDVTIAAGDWPDSINLDAGRLLGTEVHASDGTKILRVTGNDEEDLVLDGVFRTIDEAGPYRTPIQKRDRLVVIRRTGKPVRCILGGTSFMATLREFVPDSGFLDHVKYKAVLFRGVVGAPPRAATVSSWEQIEAHLETMILHAPNVGPATTAAVNAVASLLAERRGLEELTRVTGRVPLGPRPPRTPGGP